MVQGLCGFALLAMAAVAQQRAGEQPSLPAGVYRPGVNVQAPVVVGKPKPEYSQEARLAKLEGSVLLTLIVAKDGEVREVHVERPLGLGLDEKAIENVHGWKFDPGTKDGSPVEVQVNGEVFFRQPRHLWDWHLVRTAFDPPKGGSRPTVLKAQYPPASDIEENVSVQMSFEVDADGMARSVHVDRSSDPKWETEIVSAFREGWRFQAGKKDGKPVAVRGWFDFVRGSHSPIPPR
jgi:TonB family protein